MVAAPEGCSESVADSFPPIEHLAHYPSSASNRVHTPRTANNVPGVETFSRFVSSYFCGRKEISCLPASNAAAFDNSDWRNDSPCRGEVGRRFRTQRGQADRSHSASNFYCLSPSWMLNGEARLAESLACQRTIHLNLKWICRWAEPEEETDFSSRDSFPAIFLRGPTILLGPKEVGRKWSLPPPPFLPRHLVDANVPGAGVDADDGAAAVDFSGNVAAILKY